MRMRRRVRAAAVGAFPVAVIVGSTLLGAPSASAAKAPPGDNGDVKIREVVNGEVSEEKHENANDPKVCDFLIEAFNYDPGQELDFAIKDGGEKGDVVREGSFTVDDKGFGRSEIIDDLADGKYKLDVTFDGQKSNDAKHKVFKVDCPDEGVQDTAGGTTPDTTDEAPDTTAEAPEGTDTMGTAEEPAGEAPAAEEETQEVGSGSGAQNEADDRGVAEAYAPPSEDDSGAEAAGAVDAGGGGTSGPAALPAVLLGGSLLTLGAVAARRARSRG